MERNVGEPDFDFVSARQEVLDIWGGVTVVFAFCIALFWVIGAVTGEYSAIEVLTGPLIGSVGNWVLVVGLYVALLALLCGLNFSARK